MEVETSKRQYHDVRSGDARFSSEALTLDTLRAARNLELDSEHLQSVLAADAGLIERLLGNEETISPGTEQGARALLLVRLNRALGDVFGSLHRARSWLDTLNPNLDARPFELMRTRDGLERVLRLMELSSKDYAW